MDCRSSPNMLNIASGYRALKSAFQPSTQEYATCTQYDSLSIDLHLGCQLAWSAGMTHQPAPPEYGQSKVWPPERLS